MLSVLVATGLLLVRVHVCKRNRVDSYSEAMVPCRSGTVDGVSSAAPMTPESALLRVIHCLDRSLASPYKTRAFVGALEVVHRTDPVELAERARDGRLTDLDGIGEATAGVITEALAGVVPSYLQKIEAESQIDVTEGGARYRAALRGDCHLHSTWSDGGAEIEAMAETAIALGHEYMVLTDHSARLTVAHGLNEERLADQLVEIERINADIAAAGHQFRVLTGMEVDILEDGSLDLSDAMLAELDVVVASVHSKLRMESKQMTERMVMAVANPHVDILGHLTGRKIGKRPESTFDADFVFAACAQFDTAVELNCRPERLDPPRELIDLAIGYGCWFSIDSDAHATGQLEFQPYGCNRAAEREVPIERIVNTWSAEELLSWAAAR
jgi:putative hydrolase